MKIWFTKGLSNTRDAISLIKSDPVGREMTLIASHLDPDAPVGSVADEFLVEPKTIQDSDYADWVLAEAQARGVDLVMVQRRPTALWMARDRFEAAGIRLSIPAAPETLRLLDNKLLFQIDVAKTAVPAHAAIPFSDLDGFNAAWEDIRDHDEARHGLCVKPVSGIFGAGFRRIIEGADDLGFMLSSDPEAAFKISLDGFRSVLQRSSLREPMILMPYLPGLERSVDFVARKGDLLCAVARRKEGMDRILETSGPSIEAARILAKRYELDGICNLQTKECDGREVVLEINARMSGGMVMACEAGVNLPLLSVMAGLDLHLTGFAVPKEGVRVRMRDVVEILRTRKQGVPAPTPELGMEAAVPA
jgi:hypothetical protein